VWGWLSSIFHFHGHSDQKPALVADEACAGTNEGIRTIWMALVLLGLTTVIQILIVVIMKTQSHYALRLQSSAMEELKKISEEEEISINQLINVAVAEKLVVLRTTKCVKQRAHWADMEAFRQFLENGGGNEPPREGDELPAELAR
jgi:hypothetical protein